MKPTLASLCMIIAGWASCTYAEELLEKGSAKFVGWQTSVTDFTTCDKTVLKIAPDGKVRKTPTKCQGPVFALHDQIFTFKSLDMNNLTLSVEDNKGAIRQVFYPSVVEDAKTWKLDFLKPGRKLDIQFVEIPNYKGIVRAATITEPLKKD